MQPVRKIIHIDMDAFYASIEQRDFPHYQGKPLVVGGNSQRGVVAAASYEARKFGVYSAMPSRVAARKCPDLIFVRPRFEVYRQVSRQIRQIMLSYTALVEPLSLDEAYLDVTLNNMNNPSATLIAREIKTRIKAETGLTASAGVSINKFLAKIASDFQKPDGLFVIKPDQAVSFVENLPIAKFHGIGAKTAEKMHHLGIWKGADLKKHSRDQLIRWFGKVGLYYYQIVRAIDERAVKPDRERKSVGAENTFEQDLKQVGQMKQELEQLCKKVWQRLEKVNVTGKTITLKIRLTDFTTFSRSKTLSYLLSQEQELMQHVMELLAEQSVDQPVRLLGVTVSNLLLKQHNQQLRLEF
ncbi:MAG: DNA polymerase IV [Candidatus Cyclobacteriaceae bacterium M3_2C_046]